MVIRDLFLSALSNPSAQTLNVPVRKVEIVEGVDKFRKTVEITSETLTKAHHGERNYDEIYEHVQNRILDRIRRDAARNAEAKKSLHEVRVSRKQAARESPQLAKLPEPKDAASQKSMESVPTDTSSLSRFTFPSISSLTSAATKVRK